MCPSRPKAHIKAQIAGGIILYFAYVGGSLLGHKGKAILFELLCSTLFVPLPATSAWIGRENKELHGQLRQRCEIK